jgi:phosphinothricin acetyltransferase
MKARVATPVDAGAIARIYNEGIEDRIATFETRARSAADIAAWFDGIHPVVVVEDGAQVIAFASTSGYRARECYAKIAEFSVYVARARRGSGAGRVALAALITASRRGGPAQARVSDFSGERREPWACAGLWASGRWACTRSTASSRSVWKDCVIVERLT